MEHIVILLVNKCLFNIVIVSICFPALEMLKNLEKLHLKLISFQHFKQLCLIHT